MCRGMLAEPHEHPPRMDWGTQIQAQPQALGSKGRSPLKLFKFLCVAKPRKETRAAYFIGYYGFGNAGDEHLLRQAKKLVAAERSYVLPPRRLLGLWDVARRVPFMDLVVFGGGSLFQDNSSFLSMAYYLLLLSWACLWRRDVFVLGHGFGPVRSRVLSRWLAMLLPYVDRLVARDAQSYADFLSLGSRPDRTFLGVDLAYVSGAQSDLWGVDGMVAVSVNGRVSQVFESVLSAAATESGSGDFLWIAMHEGYDETRAPHVRMRDDLSLDLGVFGGVPPQKNRFFRLCRERKRRLKGLRPFNPVGMRLSSAEAALRFRACISMRYHACVWASLRGIPFLAVGDDPKLHALAHAFGQPVVSLLVSARLVQTAITTFLLKREMYRSRLLAERPAVFADAKTLVTRYRD